MLLQLHLSMKFFVRGGGGTTTQVLNDPHSTGSLVPEKEFKRARSYPLQSMPGVQNLESWQMRCEERTAALAKIPASLSDVWKDLDIGSEGTWLPTASRMISDVIRSQLYKEGFTDEDWELDGDWVVFSCHNGDL